MSPAVPTGLTVRGARVRAVNAPMNLELGTSAATISSAPLLLLDLETEEGVTGRAYVFGIYPGGPRAIGAVVEDAVAMIKGRPLEPATLTQYLLRRFRLIGVTGIVRMALSAVDGALWDAAAVAAGKPLATLLGASPRPIEAYNSNGLGLMGPEKTADEALKLLESDLKAVKLRLGYPTLEEDLAVVRAVRRALPDAVVLMTDYNQALDAPEAIRRGRAIEDEGIYWIEEPIRHDDYPGNTAIAAALDVHLQLGENFNGPEGMAQAMAANAFDLAMPDLARIGGVTGWMQAAALAAAHGIPMSSHLYPEVSAHLMTVTPTAHWLEYVDWANAVLEEPPVVRDGCVEIADRPGSGLTWDEKAVAKYAV